MPQASMRPTRVVDGVKYEFDPTKTDTPTKGWVPINAAPTPPGMPSPVLPPPGSWGQGNKIDYAGLKQALGIGGMVAGSALMGPEEAAVGLARYGPAFLSSMAGGATGRMVGHIPEAMTSATTGQPTTSFVDEGLEGAKQGAIGEGTSLALGPVMSAAGKVGQFLGKAGGHIPGAPWWQNLAAAGGRGEIARRLGLPNWATGVITAGPMAAGKVGEGLEATGNALESQTLGERASGALDWLKQRLGMGAEGEAATATAGPRAVVDTPAGPRTKWYPKNDVTGMSNEDFVTQPPPGPQPGRPGPNPPPPPSPPVQPPPGPQPPYAARPSPPPPAEPPFQPPPGPQPDYPGGPRPGAPVSATDALMERSLQQQGAYDPAQPVSFRRWFTDATGPGTPVDPNAVNLTADQLVDRIGGSAPTTVPANAAEVDRVTQQALDNLTRQQRAKTATDVLKQQLDVPHSGTAAPVAPEVPAATPPSAARTITLPDGTTMPLDDEAARAAAEAFDPVASFNERYQTGEPIAREKLALPRRDQALVNKTVAADQLPASSGLQGAGKNLGLDPTTGEIVDLDQAPKTALDALLAATKRKPPPPFEPMTLQSGQSGDAGFVYHATNAERASEIAESGKLSTFKPSEFTDQDVWPDGSTEKRAYFTASPEHSYQFAPEEGQPVLLRTPMGSAIQRESTGDLYTKTPIDASAMEILGANGQWHPVSALRKP
jgi:hypothetical protein